jgi:hypothetical protein
MRGILKSKLGDQRVGPFKIVAKVGSLAYKLKLPDNWRIHLVMSVTQLEPARVDPFEREITPPPPVDVEGAEEWEIQLITRSALRGRNRKKHYLVRWKGFRPEYDEWIAEDQLLHAKEILEEFERGERDKMQVEVRSARKAGA